MKICRICNENKALSLFVKDKRKPDGTRSYCLECDRKRRNGDKPQAQEGNKICASCKTEKSLEDFNKRKRSYDGKYVAFSYCKICERKKDSERYSHECKNCGKKYKSGRKDNKVCLECHREFMRQNKVVYKYKERDFAGEKNPMFGIQRFGKENPNYNPNKTDQEREQARLVEGYGIWRNSIFSRDHYTCKKCNDSTGGNLQAHHIESWDTAKELRLSISNGITLCKTCHKKFHSKYGFGKNTTNQLEEFLNYNANTEITF
ncbi:HNH endonuclease [Kurthia sp. Dielmo]|uniref:HNH endonuclease n=1 Tax=Kurthia sp. Dielmo TaxID=1033738 RepID=UPI0002E9100E|nr:HNH endonuclease [Kurthia sp. Dielmo]